MSKVQHFFLKLWSMGRTKLILEHGKDEVDFGSWKGRG